ncbi:IQ domain-containing protein C [Lonchura striata]
MAAEAGPEAERRRLLRAVTGLQEPNPGKTGEEVGEGRGRAPPPDPPNLGAPSPGGEEEEEEEEEGDTESSESPGILQELRALPRRELQRRRLQLQLELLWIQQAVASRKHFLLLKQKLGIPPDACSSIPEFLHCWGEALELQQLQQQQQP